MEDIPVGNESPEVPLLRVYDVAQAEAACQDQHAHQREPERDFVAHHLRAGAESAQQGILVVRRPSGERHAVDADRGHAENQEQSGVHIGRDLQRDSCSPQSVMSVAERNHRDRGQRENDRDQWGRKKQRLVDVRAAVRSSLKKKFQAVGERLQQAERADAGGSPAILHVAHDFALQPNRVGHRREQNQQHDRRFDDRRQDVKTDWQRAASSLDAVTTSYNYQADN